MHMLIETVIYEGRTLKHTWDPSHTPPPRELVTQASGICFTHEGKIVLVAGRDQEWSLPGGHPETGESIEQAFVREVWEEACAVVEHLAFLGAQQVDDPEVPDGPKRYYQTRFWARIHLEPFHPRFEKIHRKLVTSVDFLSQLSWGSSQIAQALFDLANEQERQFLSNDKGPLS
jgi:ADP-ribose pyrophosphatase YjhB (NUDIX family)